jgi:hypothetical protein
MKGHWAALVVSLVGSAPLLAQERDRSLERISLALQQPTPIASDIGPLVGVSPKTLGIFTLVPPTGPGEMVRVSVPIGALVSRALQGVAAANQRRQELAARRKVEAALEWFAEQPHTPNSK